jgi:anti-sigma regulatory factor (Ser/Thr protein kinase)
MPALLSSPKMTKEIVIVQSDPKELGSLRRHVHSFLKQTPFSKEERDRIMTAVGEGCTNAIRHAYDGETRHKVRLTMENHPAKLVFKIRDYGKKFDPKKIKTPELPPQKPHGLGIHFMRTFMDELAYDTSHKKGNELILVKFKSNKGGSHEV